MKYLLTLILMISVLAYADDDKSSRGKIKESNVSITNPSTEAVIFEENFNAGNNTPDGLAIKGWVFVNVDGGGITSCFTGNPLVFVAYEGPDSGYVGQNFNGANGMYINQWLITPSMTVSIGDTLSFWWKAPEASTYPDSVIVHLSPTAGTTPAAFTVVVMPKTKVPTTATWQNVKVVINNSGLVRLAFQYLIYSGGASGAYSDYIGFDLVQVRGGQIPVELTSFNASVTNNNVSLTWQTATETNNKGFEIQKKSESGEFVTVGFVNGAGTTTQAQSYTYTDSKIAAGKYTYRLRQVDFSGSFEYSKNVEVNVVTPLTFSLEQNYPNPFNPSTSIAFNLAVDSKVSLKVFNILGQEVSTLVNGLLTAGSHTVQFNAKNLQSGIYLAKIEASGIDGKSFTSVKKMILNK